MNRNTLTSAAYCAEPAQAATILAGALHFDDAIALIDALPDSRTWMRATAPHRMIWIGTAIDALCAKVAVEMNQPTIMADPNDSVGTRD